VPGALLWQELSSPEDSELLFCCPFLTSSEACSSERSKPIAASFLSKSGKNNKVKQNKLSDDVTVKSMKSKNNKNPI
jgi:hypothetical protein